jgi:hypothetical protein
LLVSRDSSTGLDRTIGEGRSSETEIEQAITEAVARLLYLIEIPQALAEFAEARSQTQAANAHANWMRARERARRFGVDIDAIDKKKGWHRPYRRSWV